MCHTLSGDELTSRRSLGKTTNGRVLLSIYDRLYAYYGQQHWWPTRRGSRWEIMLGTVLTQRTSWSNVALALDNTAAMWGEESLSEPELVLEASHESLTAILRPAGFYASKPQRLKNLAKYVLDKGGVEAFANSVETTDVIRRELLSLWGIGPETADAILLYALNRPVFVADAYALRLTSRWGLLESAATYEKAQALFMDNLPHDAALFNEYHALIVAHAKRICRVQARCEVCSLNQARSLGGLGEETWACPKLHVTRQTHQLEG